MTKKITEKETLEYPFSKRPPNGDVLEVSPNLYWLRMPLPIALNHINLWLLEGKNGWTIIDSGMANDESKEVWINLFETLFKGKSLEKLLITHMHLDHSGLAGWLSDHWNLDPYFTEKEYQETQILSEGIEKSQEFIALDFYKSCGYDDASIKRYLERVSYRKTLVTPLNRGYNRIRDKEIITLGDHEWEIMIATGHSPEHACLYSKENNIFVCGDVLLPRITPNISVRPFHAESNPLNDWINSLKEIKERVPDDALILPSHGYPYYGAHKRIDSIVEDHMDKLKSLHKFCKHSKNVIEVFPALFANEINENALILAVGESLAHLNYLIGEGKMEMKKNSDGVNCYKSI
tara:strand:- start:13939 stop:14985 length:1047 start_codon:yes stop_codon:yes gene_type:complete